MPNNIWLKGFNEPLQNESLYGVMANSRTLEVGINYHLELFGFALLLSLDFEGTLLLGHFGRFCRPVCI